MTPRYYKITDGCSINEIALGEPGEVSGVDYNYYLMVRPGGSGVIMREKSTQDEYRFFVFGSTDDMDALWAGRQTYTYKRSSEYKSL